ncbi:MAG TPA: NAD(P)-dependent alcohol dehydrogenase [Vicinamibacterales bacterium]|nr:NAD(P)-dependent alcohol dehydrogenase [Vicinamibacterales bacterium]
MKAARLHEYGHALVIDDVPTPSPGAGQVLVKIEGAGFCHSDIHVIDGEIRILPRMPLTLGHENAGVVAALGSGVTSVRVGDPVAIFGGWGCGLCDYCVTGHEQLCESPQWAGLSVYDGGYAEYMLVPHERYLVTLTTLSTKDAAPLTDAALTPYRAIKKALPFLEPDHEALVIGLGGLGQYGFKLLKVLAGCPVIVVDVDERKLALARELGAVHALNGKDPDVAAKIRDLTRGHGVSASFDFVGSDATLALAVGATRALGKVSQIGLAGGAARMQVLQNTRFEVQFEATLWGTIKELREVIGLAERGQLTSIPIEPAPLDRINDVYARLKRGEIQGRAVITPAA